MTYTVSNTTYQEEIYSIPAQPVILLAKPWSQISKSEIELINRILSLANISLSNVRVLHQEKLDLDWISGCKKVIAFGVKTSGLPTNELFEVQGTKVIVTSEPETLQAADKETKQKLARAVKQLFA